MKVTRTVNTYKAEAYSIVKVDGKPVPQKFAEVTYLAGSDSEAEARKAFRHDEIIVPRGSQIIVNLVNETKYACTIEEFLTVATPVEEN